MKIVEYNEVDPLRVFYTTKLALDFALTAERATQIRQLDPRLFPCLSVCAVEGEEVLGQVGVFRLPMISTEGREEVGGIWAVSTHPQHAGRGVASCLLEAAHERMRAAGLRFSTLDTDRYRVAHHLYHKHGYEDMQVWATGLARWETAHQPTRLHARPVGSEGYDFVELVFNDLAQGYLGFAWRYMPFERLRRVPLSDLWILRESQHVVGYAIAQADPTMLTITNLTLRQGVAVAEAIAALAAELKSRYVKVTLTRPVEMDSLRRAGFHVAHPNWGAFMVKPLVPGVTAEDTRHLFGIGTDRFLISWLDVT